MKKYRSGGTDFRVDLIVTPEPGLFGACEPKRPTGLDWDSLSLLSRLPPYRCSRDGHNGEPHPYLATP